MDNQLKMLEVERKRLHTEATRDVVAWNAKMNTKEGRREYALSDPNQLKKEKALPEEMLGVLSFSALPGLIVMPIELLHFSFCMDHPAQYLLAV